MNYLRITSTGIIYPYLLDKIYLDFPDVSFPAILNERILSEYNIFPVTEKESPTVDISRFKTTLVSPVLLDGSWTEVWEVNELTDQEKVEVHAEKADLVRVQRDQLLASTDWYIIKALETNTTVPDNITQYRQALRDITQQPDFPFNVIWPTI